MIIAGSIAVSLIFVSVVMAVICRYIERRFQTKRWHRRIIESVVTKRLRNIRNGGEDGTDS